MKKNILKRLLSLALALVMVAGWMPRMATEAHAAEPITLSDDTFTTSPGEGFAFRAYFYCGECKKEVYIDSNIDNHKFEITSFTYKIANGTAQWNLTANYQGCRGSGTGTNTYSCRYNCTENLKKYLLYSYGWDQSTKKYHGSIDVYLTREKTTHQGDATCKTAANCTLCGTSYTNANNHEKPNEFTYSVNTSDSTKHDVKYACCGATKETVAHTAEPTYTVNATDHTKHDKTYSCCEGIAETTGHSYTYTANGFVLTEKCSNGCGHQAIASIVAGEAIYTGSEITNAATISYDSGTWAGDEPVLSFENNVNVGTATAKMTAGDATASATFKINPANLSNVTVTLDPASGTYTGSVHNRPTYTLTYNGKQLVENTDYIVDGQWTGDFLNVGDSILTLKGEGNFTGYNTLTYTIHKAAPTANLFEMTLPQNPVYDGTTTFPVTVTPKTTDLGEITAVKYNGSTEAPINAGTYKVTVDVAESENYNAIYDLELGSFTIAPTAGSIIIPANQSVVYDGAAVEQSDLTPAITTDGALTVKWYDSDGTEIAAPTDVGTYQIGISAAAGSNYNAVEEVKQTFTITKADPICTAPTANNGLVYNGREQTLVIPVESMGGTVYYSLDGVTYTDYVPKGINAQEYTVYYKVVGDANHNDMEPKTVTAKIAPWNIETASCKASVRGGPFTYNGQEHTPTPQIDAWVNDYPVPGNPYAPGEDVRLTKDTDYTVTYSNNVNAGEAVVTFTGKGNYTGTITRKFTIDPKPITVTIADKTSVYGEAVAELTAATDGIVNNDTNVYSLATDASSTANVGTYPITGTALDANYTITFEDGTYTITKALAVATAPTAVSGLIYNTAPQTLIATGSTNDGNIVYSLDKDGEYKAELPQATAAGTYYVWYKVIGDGNHNDSAPADLEVKIDKADPGIGAVTAGVVNDTLATSAIVLTRANTDIPGTLTVDAEQTLVLGENTIRYTFTPNDTANYKVVTGEVAVTVVDTIVPTGTVTVSTKSWAEFLNDITFGLFFKETQTVSVTADDNLSGVAKIEYIESKTAMNLDAVKAATQWTEMKNGSVSVTASDAKQFIYYIRITDKSGNVAFLSSDGAEYDTTAPVIAGVDNGVTYYTTQNVTVTDKNIDTITLNGETATGSISLAGSKEATYTIVATDKAGNSTTVTVKMAPISDITAPVDGKSEANVTSDDKTNLQTIVDTVTELLKDEDMTAEEKAALEKAKDDAEALIEVIEDTANTQKAVTDKEAEYDEDAVKSTDKAELEELAKDIDALLDTKNLTQDERAALETLLEQVEDMIDTINATAADKKAATDTVDSYDPATVTSSDKAAIESALDTIEDLLDTKHLTGAERDALEDAKADAEALLDAIDEATKAADTDNTAKVEDVTADNVTPEDKSDLEKAKDDLEDALEKNGGNYTEEEKKAIEDEIKRIEDALETLENVEAVEDAISDLPATVEPDDEETVAKIEEAKKAYDELTDYEKSLVDEKVKEKLDKLTAAAVAYDIVKGDGGKWSKGTTSGLSFTVNGPISKFISVEIDGKVIDAKYYSAKAGSTIIALNASYLETLATGEHTITVVYSDGEAEGTFKVNAKSVTPATGDDSNIMLWGGAMVISLAALVVLLAESKKRRYVK